VQLDSYDRKILTVVQQDAALSFVQIGERVHLSPSAVLRRLARLKKSGVIVGTFMVVDPKVVGRPVTIIVEITLENERTDLLAETKSALASSPEVQHCFYVTGDTDIVAIVTSTDMDAYENFTQRVLRGNPNIKRFRTSVVLDRIKSSLFVPV
jgi:Lrp/AsnC family leucine-responsive transcriptional regulator